MNNAIIKKLLKTPIHIIVMKLMKLLQLKIEDNFQKIKDINSSYNFNNIDINIIKENIVDINHLEFQEYNLEVVNYLNTMYCQHRFDLLGTGWVKNSYNSISLGCEGFKYEMIKHPPELSMLNYIPIDWQKDFKSGYRWSNKVWYKDQKIVGISGADVKVPWELSRLQHLPQMALFSIYNKSLKLCNIKEFMNQISDFIENNPVRMGINWYCTMDISIRAVNMLIAYDMFCQQDIEKIIDLKFKKKFTNYIYLHGLHILNNLEYNNKFTNNHYLSNIAGLLFISTYLESTEQIDLWLAFSIQELLTEMDRQFYDDGGNFESSTSYHRLSGEIVLYCTSLILGLKKEKVLSLQNYCTENWKGKKKLFDYDKQNYTIIDDEIILPKWFINKLYKIGRFSLDITKPSGNIPQIGDNDSGRFVKMSPIGEFISNIEAENMYLNLKGYNNSIKNYSKKDEEFWDENILNHESFVSAFSGIFDKTIFNSKYTLEKSIVKSISKRKLSIDEIPYCKPNVVLSNINNILYTQKREYPVCIDLNELTSKFYPQSGIYIFKSEVFFLSVCLTPIGQGGKGGHSHNDKLSYEIWHNGFDIEVDPGTYLYTPFASMRNKFRSISAHNVIHIDDIEQSQFDGLFGLKKEVVGEVLSISSKSIELMIHYNGSLLRRSIVIETNKIKITDNSNKTFIMNSFGYYSNGYGKIMKRKN